MSFPHNFPWNYFTQIALDSYIYNKTFTELSQKDWSHSFYLLGSVLVTIFLTFNLWILIRVKILASSTNSSNIIFSFKRSYVESTDLNSTYCIFFESKGIRLYWQGIRLPPPRTNRVQYPWLCLQYFWIWRLWMNEDIQLSHNKSISWNSTSKKRA